MITFENYTDKNEIVQDCLDYIEPFIDKDVESDEKKVTDCTDIETDIIIQNYYLKLVS